MSNEYLQERDRKTIAASRALLKELPSYVRDFYESKEKKELTKYAYLLDVKMFLEYLSPILHEEVKTFPFEKLGFLNAQDINEYKEDLSRRGYSNASIKRRLASLSTFYKYLVAHGYFDKNPVALVEWPQEDRNKAIIYLDDEQTARLLDGIYRNDKQLFYFKEAGRKNGKARLEPAIGADGETQIKGAPKNKNSEYEVRDIEPLTKMRRERIKLRNYCITFLFLKTGMRVSELVSVDLDDIDFRSALINVTGKGGKTRPVGFDEEALVEALKQYINVERRNLTRKNRNEKALFVSPSGKRLTVRSIETMIKEMVQTYLVDDEFIRVNDFSPHKLRSTCASRLLRETGNIKGVSDYLGHDDVSITARRYAALSRIENAKEMGSQKLLGK